MSGTVSLRITLRYKDLDEFVARYAENVSSAGLFLRTRAPKPTGTRIRFELLLADGAKAFAGEGVVVAVRADDKPGMGIRFHQLDPGSDELMKRIVGAHGEGALAPAPLGIARTLGRAVDTWAPPSQSLPQDWSRPSWSAPAPEPERADPVRREARRPTSLLRPWAQRATPEPDPAAPAAPARPSLAPPPRPAAASPARDDVDFSSVLELLAKGADLGGASSIVRAERVATSQLGARLPDDAALGAADPGGAARRTEPRATPEPSESAESASSPFVARSELAGDDAPASGAGVRVAAPGSGEPLSIAERSPSAELSRRVQATRREAEPPAASPWVVDPVRAALPTTDLIAEDATLLASAEVEPLDLEPLESVPPESVPPESVPPLAPTDDGRVEAVHGDAPPELAPTTSDQSPATEPAPPLAEASSGSPVTLPSPAIDDAQAIANEPSVVASTDLAPVPSVEPAAFASASLPSVETAPVAGAGFGSRIRADDAVAAELDATNDDDRDVDRGSTLDRSFEAAPSAIDALAVEVRPPEVRPHALEAAPEALGAAPDVLEAAPEAAMPHAAPDADAPDNVEVDVSGFDDPSPPQDLGLRPVVPADADALRAVGLVPFDELDGIPPTPMHAPSASPPRPGGAASTPREAMSDPESEGGSAPRRPTLELVPFAELTPSGDEVVPLLESGALAGAIDVQLAAISEIQAASLVSSEVVAPQTPEAPPLGDPWVPSVQVVPLGAADVDFDRWRLTAPQAVIDPAFLEDALERDGEPANEDADAAGGVTSSSAAVSSSATEPDALAPDAPHVDPRPTPLFAAMLEATLAPASPPPSSAEIRGFDTARVDLLAGWDPVDEQPAGTNEATQRIAVELTVGPRVESLLAVTTPVEPDNEPDSATTRIAVTTGPDLSDAAAVSFGAFDAPAFDAPVVDAHVAPTWMTADDDAGEQALGEAAAPLAGFDAAFEATFSIAPPAAAPSAAAPPAEAPPPTEAELEPAWPVRAVAIATQEVILPPLETLRASAPSASDDAPGAQAAASEIADALRSSETSSDVAPGPRWADAVSAAVDAAPRLGPSVTAGLVDAAPEAQASDEAPALEVAPSSSAASALDADLALDTVSRWRLAFDASTEMLSTSSAPLPAQVPAEQRSTRISVRGLDASAFPAATEAPRAPSTVAASWMDQVADAPLERVASSAPLAATATAEELRVEVGAPPSVSTVPVTPPQPFGALASKPPIPLPPSKPTTVDIVPPIILGVPSAPVAPAARLPSVPGLGAPSATTSGDDGIAGQRDAEPTARIRAPAPIERARAATPQPAARLPSQAGVAQGASLEPAARFPSSIGAQRAPLPRSGSSSTAPHRANSGITVGPVTSSLDAPNLAPIVAPSVAYEAPPTGEIELPRRRSLGGPARDALALDLASELRVARAAAGQVEVVALQSGASRRVAVGLGPDGAVLSGADLDAAPPSRVIALREVLGRLADPPDVRRAMKLDGEQVDTLELLRIGLGGLLRQHERTFGAGRPAVVLTVPRALDPDAEDMILRAGGAAGLDVRGLVPELLALARGLGVERPGVESALVVEVSASGATLAVLRRGRDGLAVAAQVERESVSIARADALVREGLGDADEALTREALSRARSELRRESVVTLRLPSGEVRLSRARLQQLLEPLLVELAQGVREVLGAAGVHPKVLGTTVLVGELGAPGAQVVGNVVGREVVVASDVEDARLRGLLRLADAKVSSRPQQLEQDIGVALPGGRFHVLIARGTSLPAKVSRKHATVRDQQAEFELTFYEGTSETVQGATLLGALMLGPLPKAPRGAVEVEVTLAVDADAVLSVVFAEPKSGLRRRLSAATRATPAERRVEMAARAAVEDLSEQRAKPKTGLWDRLLGRR